MGQLLKISHWCDHFENNRTRELAEMAWVPVPNKQDGDGYRSIMARVDGLEVIGAWLLILEVASKCDPRGVLLRENGEPHTADTLSRVTGASAKRLAKAITVLTSDDIGWLQSEEFSGDRSSIAENFNASGADKKRAHGRVNRLLAKGDSVLTPHGPTTVRPLTCQWCEAQPGPAAREHPNVLAHHLFGYGTKEHDTTVVFVCRSCHGFFESGKYTTADILERYGIQWLRGTVIKSPPGAIASQADASVRAGAQNGTEWNGMEGKRKTHGSPEPQAAAVPAVLVFSTVGSAKSWDLIQQHIDSLKEAFPDLDILAECRKARKWCEDNSGNRKTPKGMAKFLFGWMSRAQNGKVGASKSSDPRGTQSTYDEWAKEQLGKQHG